MAHLLTLDELQQLTPRPKAAKFCSHRHRLRTPEGRPTINLLVLGRRDREGAIPNTPGELTEGHTAGWTYLEVKGCRACKNESRRKRRADA